jgi:hypothetical protein
VGARPTKHGPRRVRTAGSCLPVAYETDLAGIGIFAATVEDTRTIMDDDPDVWAGVFTYDVHLVRGFPGASLA